MDELFDFLSSPRLDVKNEAVKIVAGLTGDKQYFEFFKTKNQKPIQDLMLLVREEPLTAHDALAALTNLSVDVSFIETMADTAFLNELILMMMLPNNVNADLCCMLMNNLSKHDLVQNRLLPRESDTGTQKLDNLLEIFNRGETSFNPNAKFHFLAGVFANISASPQGCKFFLGHSTVDNTLRLTKLVIFTEHPNLVRRGGVISTLKNVCYAANLENKGLDVLLHEDVNLFVYVLLPLSGPEDYTDEEMEGMPAELQLLEPEKKRELDPQLRMMLVEILIALSSTRPVRQLMREIQVYHVVKKLHLQEKNEDVQELIETLVNQLMRDEAEE
jgi:hypothetical protein